MNSMSLMANNTTINGIAPQMTAEGGMDFQIATGGMTAVKLEDISAAGTTDVAVSLAQGRQYWLKITNPGNSMTVNLNLDATMFPDGSTAEFCIEYPNASAFQTPVAVKHNGTALHTVTLTPATPFALVKVAWCGGGLEIYSL